MGRSPTFSQMGENFFIETIRSLPNLEEVRFHMNRSPYVTERIVSAINEHPRLQFLHVESRIFSRGNRNIALPLRKIACRRLIPGDDPDTVRRQAAWATRLALVTSLTIMPTSDVEWMNHTFPGLHVLNFINCSSKFEHCFLARHPSLRRVSISALPRPERSESGQEEIQNMTWLQDFHGKLEDEQAAPRGIIEAVAFERMGHGKCWECSEICLTLEKCTNDSSPGAIRAVCHSFPALKVLSVKTDPPTEIPAMVCGPRLFLQMWY